MDSAQDAQTLFATSLQHEALMSKTQPSNVTTQHLATEVTGRFRTILADPPWRFKNRTGRVAPEYRRVPRYQSLSFEEIANLPVGDFALDNSHLYLWVPNALLHEGLTVMEQWGFEYKTNLVWYKIRKDGGPDGRGVGFYFRNVTELVLFGVRGSFRTLQPGRRQVNIISTRKREHSRKPDELYDIIEECSPGPFLELFARHRRVGWTQWGDEVDDRAGELDPQTNSQVVTTSAALEPHKSSGSLELVGAIEEQ